MRSLLRLVLASTMFLSTLLVVTLGGVRPAGAAVVFGSPFGGSGYASNGLRGADLEPDDFSPWTDWEVPSPGNILSLTDRHGLPVPLVWLDNPDAVRGWQQVDSALSTGEILPRQWDLTGYWTSVRAQWSSTGGRDSVSIAPRGRATFATGARAGVVRDMKMPMTPIRTLRAGRLVPDDDRSTASMDKTHEPYVMLQHTTNKANGGRLLMSMFARNTEDNCWYQKNSQPTERGGLSLFPIGFAPWLIMPGQRRNSEGKCEPESTLMQAADGVRVEITLAHKKNVSDPKDRDALLPFFYTHTADGWGLTSEGDPIYLSDVVGVASSADANRLGVVLVERTNGSVVRVDPAHSSDQAVTPVQMTDLNPFAPPASDHALAAVEWGGMHVVSSLVSDASHLLLRKLDSPHGAKWDLGSPTTNVLKGETVGSSPLLNAAPVFSANPLSNAPLSSPNTDLFVTVRTQDGQAWQNRLTYVSDVETQPTKNSGWYRLVSADPDFPTVPLPRPVLGLEVVQSWTVTPMQPGSDGTNVLRDGSRVTVRASGATQLLLVKTDQRILATALRTEVGTSTPVWSSITPASFPTTSDMQPLQVVYNGGRTHQLIVNDSRGRPWILPLIDSQIGACVWGVDSGCPSSGTVASPAYELAAVAPSASTAQQTAAGDVSLLTAPPEVTGDRSPTRYVLQGTSKQGHTVQNVWSSSGWSGWYRSDQLPDNPAVGGNVFAVGRIVSTESRVFTASTASEIRTAWTRLDTLPKGNKAIELHVGGFDATGKRRLSFAVGIPVPSSVALLDSPTPVVNDDASITLFAPYAPYAQSAPGVVVARWDPETQELTDWTPIPKLQVGSIGDVQTIGATAGTMYHDAFSDQVTQVYTLAYAKGAAHTLGILGVTVKWTGPSSSIQIATPDDVALNTDLGGQILSAPALVNDTDGTIVIAVNGRDGLFFQRMRPKADGGLSTAWGYTRPYQTESGTSPINVSVSPNATLDESGEVQVSVVDQTGTVRIGWLVVRGGTEQHNMPVPESYRWDDHDDSIAGSVTSSVAFFSPVAGLREIIASNRYNNGIDFRVAQNGAWSPYYTSNGVAAKYTGDASVEETSMNPYL